MSEADGFEKQRRKTISGQTKATMEDGKNILEKFRKKYKWFFTQQEQRHETSFSEAFDCDTKVVD